MENRSLRQSRHLLEAKNLRATENHEDDRNIFTKKTQVTLEEGKLGDQNEDPFEKVRLFLEKQDL